MISLDLINENRRLDTEIPCRICGNANNNTLYHIREMMFGSRELFEYSECSSCGCLQLVQLPDDISKYYPDEYYSFNAVSKKKCEMSLKQYILEYLMDKRDLFLVTGKGFLGKYINYHTLLPIREDITVGSIYSFFRKIGLRKSHKILDIGCGNGELLYLLADIGFKKTLGIDYYIPRDIRYENGLRILKKTIFDIGGQYDLIMLNHSFEHMENPGKVLQSIAGLLKPNGTCMIRIPTVSSHAWKHYRENWIQIDAPRHFFLHSLKSMEILCAQAGFLIEDVVYDAMSFHLWGSEQYKRGIPFLSERSWKINPERSIFSMREMEVFESRTRELNEKKMGDQAAFFIKKRNDF